MTSKTVQLNRNAFWFLCIEALRKASLFYALDFLYSLYSFDSPYALLSEIAAAE